MCSTIMVMCFIKCNWEELQKYGCVGLLFKKRNELRLRIWKGSGVWTKADYVSDIDESFQQRA